jgi:hypothetical protein
MLFFGSWMSGIVPVMLGQQGVLEFLGVFLFIFFGVFVLSFVLYRGAALP